MTPSLTEEPWRQKVVMFEEEIGIHLPGQENPKIIIKKSGERLLVYTNPLVVAL